MKREELLALARRHMWAAWQLSSEELASQAAATLDGLGMLVPEGGAAELERVRRERDEFCDRVDTLTAVAKGNKRHVVELTTECQRLQAELSSERERYKAGLRRADEQVNAMNAELKRYADGDETPVLWSVYNGMHGRALAAEGEAKELRARVAELEAEQEKLVRWHGEDSKTINRLVARVERRQARLVALQNDALAVRGSLAPADGPRAVPFELGETLTPAVEWLINRVAELERRIEAEECRCPEPAPLCEGCRCRCHSSEDAAPAAEPDAITRRIAPTQALREPEPQPDPS